PLMFSIAYRMTGSISDAEDIVQEAFLRLTRALRDGTSIDSPKAFLATVTTRLAISHLRSARVRRESYVGAWLPEPLLADPDPDPAERAEMSDSLSMAFLVLLESLTPTERAVFLLHEVFGYDYKEIAGITGKSETNCRQILTRARHHVDDGKPRFDASREQREEVARRFFAAAEGGDLGDLLELLAPDVVMVGDGGGKAWATAQPISGAERVARLLLGLYRRAPRWASASSRPSSTASPGPLPTIRRTGSSTCSPSTSPTAGCRRSDRSSTPISCATWARSPMRPCGVTLPRTSRASTQGLNLSAMATDFTEETAADAVVDSFA